MDVKQMGWPGCPRAGELCRYEDELCRYEDELYWYEENMCLCEDQVCKCRIAVFHITLIRGMCPSSLLYAMPACCHIMLVTLQGQVKGLVMVFVRNCKFNYIASLKTNTSMLNLTSFFWSDLP